MNNNLPKITVLIANWNYGRFIEGCIKSVFNQTYPHGNINLVIVDDHSTDNSMEVIKKTLFGFQDFKQINGENKTAWILKQTQSMTPMNIAVIRLHEHVSVSEARNIGIEFSLENTDFYQILDADDEMYSNKLEELVVPMLMSSAVGVTYADYDILNMNTGTVLREYKEPFNKQRLLQECIVHSGSMVRKDALINSKDQYGFFDGRLRVSEDYDLFLRISEKYMIFHIAKALTLVRNHNQNSTLTVNNEVRQQCYALMSQKFKERNNI